MFVRVLAERAFCLAFALLPILQAQKLQVDPVSLSFVAADGGDSPTPQTIAVFSADGSPLTFLALADDGTGKSEPPWLQIRPAHGNTPGKIFAAIDPTYVGVGTYKARIRVTVGDSTTGAFPTIDIPVTLEVRDVPPKIEVVPAVVRTAATLLKPVAQKDLLVRNAGGEGSLDFAVTIPDPGLLKVEVTPQRGRTTANVPVSLHLNISTAGLAPGIYRAVVRVISTAGAVDVPLRVFVADAVPILDVNFKGIRFDARQGNGDSQTRNASVLNTGAPGTKVNWKAEVVTGSEWLVLGATSGTVTPEDTTPSRLPLSVNKNAFSLAPGPYYALVKVTDAFALNSPQFLVAVLNLAPADSQPKPDPAPQGLFFTGAQGTTLPSQPIRVFTSSATAVPFQASAATDDGEPWLLINGSATFSGRTSTDAVNSLAVTVNTAGLAPGVYTGEVDVALAGSLRSTSVTLVLQPPPASAAVASKGQRNAAGCAPSRLSLTQTGLASNFVVPAGWPTQLLVRLADDCGDPVLNGQMVAVFNNGDPPQIMELTNDQFGLYSATWAPSSTAAQVAVTARATAPNMQSASAVISGKVTANQVPVLAQNGTLNNLNPVIGGSLAPGTVVQIQGAAIASATVSPGVIPLPTTFNGSSVIVGGIEAPLYFLSNSQINAQLPTQLTPGQQYQIIVNANGALTLPDTLDFAPATPGLAAFPDGRIIAQHADFTLIDATHPVAPGEVIILYLVGMGRTNPTVNTGTQAPGSEPLARLAIQPSVTIGGQPASVLFAGLTPGGIGLYQINCVVPSTARTGLADVVVKQDVHSSNTARLPVR